MSEAQTTQQPTPQDAPAPADPDDATTPLQAPGEAPNGDAKPAPDPEEERKSERRREAQRVGQLTRQKFQEKARADALEQKLREMEARLNPGAPPSQDLEREIDRRADERAAQREHDKRFADWDTQGREQFGDERFRAACQTVADLASPEQRGMLAQVALDSEGGQKAIMELAENPAEAERILALPPHKMALALAKLGTPPAAAAPKPVSNAPPPIRPPSAGRARGEPDPEHGSFQTGYLPWSAGQQWRR